MTGRLPEDEARRLQDAPFTYAEVGAATLDVLPPGYHHLDRERAFPVADLERLADGIMSWGLQTGAGLHVRASAPRAEPGAVVLMRLGPPGVGVRVPCRVVAVLDEPDRVGFSYGTLPGHPERGEELFVVERRGEHAVVRIRAFSRPGTALSRAIGPLGRVAQQVMTDRYLAAAARF